ncbi:cell wall-active antibiotics response protein [Paenibacillus sp. IB182496]|uniref:Cell wall-active antibiotics response protein n=1 Tax=Paenibacillus sabuli TaxID=2772509 RepID=A0A927BUR7_9BACL|nr:cell wall-active antibiotics response protein LiaF [Paenibacillus sabuli]MBD2845753.1 cell wall-active antibiotics response protein [Paenibacillus sabuli]
MNTNVTKRLLWGLIIVGLGLAILLRQLDIITFDLGDVIATFWPVILIVIGLNGVLGSSSSGSYGQGSGWWNWFMMGLGVYFLSSTLNLHHFSIGDLIPYAIPVVLIIVGVRMMVSRDSGKGRQESEEWQAYEMSPPPPPPPPLHPDPTRDMRGAPGAEYGPEQARQRDDDRQPGAGGRYDTGASGWQERSRHGHAGGRRRHERVEWWNSDPSVQTRSGFIGDIHIGQDYWELTPMNISHFIGDTVLDLTKAQIPYGETRITVSSFIGDVKVFVPVDHEVGIEVHSSTFIGDCKIPPGTGAGAQAYGDHENEKRIRLVISSFIGDIRVTKVG